MAPRMGRPPSNNPKGNRKSYRLSNNDMKMLKKCISETGKKETEIIRMGIEAAYKSINLQREEIFFMSNKYERSFKVDDDEIPEECPICGVKFCFSEDIDISPYKNGYRSVLMCPKCNFQKVVSYEIDDASEDEEYEMKEIENDNKDEEFEDDIMSKEKMLKEMDDNIWNHDLSEEDSWDEIKEEYDNMNNEYSNNTDLFPNGRDYDAENEDRPF